MKTKIIGWLFILVSLFCMYLFFGNVIVNMFFPEINDMVTRNILKNLLADTWYYFALPVGIFFFVLGSAIRSKKTWAWYAGMTVSSLLLIRMLYEILVSIFSVVNLVILGILIWMIYSFIVEKQLFFKNKPSSYIGS